MSSLVAWNKNIVKDKLALSLITYANGAGYTSTSVRLAICGFVCLLRIELQKKNNRFLLTFQDRSVMKQGTIGKIAMVYRIVIWIQGFLKDLARLTHA